MSGSGLQDLIAEHDRAKATGAPTRGRAGSSSARRTVMLAAAVVMLAIAGVVVAFQIKRATDSPGAGTNVRVAVDSLTGEVFKDFRVRDGAAEPWRNPKTGKDTLYSAEPCHWTADGKAKLEPTWVLLNQTIGKPGPTVCPDCGRTVIPHNPMPPMHLMDEAARAARGG